jgi:hypothetical protein
MRGPEHEHLAGILRGFDIPGDLVLIEPFGGGHINETLRSTWEGKGSRRRYIHQRINRQVFRKPEEVMDNIARVLGHLRGRILAAGQTEPERRCMTLVPARGGGLFLRDGEGEYWRSYAFIEGTRSRDLIKSDSQAVAIARAVGGFLALVADLPAPRLHDTIPFFHDAPSRYRLFRTALAEDASGRAASVRSETDWLLENEERTCAIVSAMEGGGVPERITHNDTKANNILLDERTDEALCVVDLDTVMPGSLLYDFGDLVRTSAGTALEDEPDALRMAFLPSRFRALVAGFLEGTAGIMTQGERALLPEAGRIITTIMGLRFLTDYLSGDSYYRVHRPGHNLDRTRTQIALVRSMDTRMGEIIAACEGAPSS